MPNTIEGLLLVIGALFLMIGLIGGGFEVSAAKIPPVGTKGRVGSALAGVIFLAFAIRSVASRQAQTAPPPPTVTQPSNVVAVKDPPAAVSPQSESAGTTEKPAAVTAVLTPVPNRYYRLQLRYNKQYIDAAYCSSKLGLNPGSDYDGGSCELFRFVSTGDGWNLLQLMSNGQYLDACSTNVMLSATANADDSGCQQWRLIPAGDGWSRLQLKRDQQYLSVTDCSTTIGLGPTSDVEEGACQLWRLVAQ
jgi:hypothetical protein